MPWLKCSVLTLEQLSKGNEESRQALSLNGGCHRRLQIRCDHWRRLTYVQSRCRLQRLRSSGGAEQVKATRCASARPSSLRALRLFCSAWWSAPAKPCNAKRRRTRATVFRQAPTCAAICLSVRGVASLAASRIRARIRSRGEFLFERTARSTCRRSGGSGVAWQPCHQLITTPSHLEGTLVGNRIHEADQSRESRNHVG